MRRHSGVEKLDDQTVVTIDLLEHIDKMHIKVSWNNAFTGHDHYKSPYETYDDCGNCSGARCDSCHKILEYSLWTVSIRDMTALNTMIHDVAKASVYLPDNSTMQNWLDVINDQLGSHYNEDDEEWEFKEEIEFDFLKIKFVFVNFNMDDIETYKNDLLNFVYIIKGKDSHLVFDKKEDAELLASVFDTHCYTDLKINAICRALEKHLSFKMIAK
jgi:hypothetical protein